MGKRISDSLGVSEFQYINCEGRIEELPNGLVMVGSSYCVDTEWRFRDVNSFRDFLALAFDKIYYLPRHVNDFFTDAFRL